MIRFCRKRSGGIERPLGIGGRALGAFLLGCAVSASRPAMAGANLQISPVLLEAPAGAVVTNVTVANQDSRAASMQVRVFRWRQAEGEETLTPADDVVASPPIATIEPHTSLNIRVIRTAKTEVESEEAYRLVIDQLPRNEDGGRKIVAMVLREVLPVFFEPAEHGTPEVSWTIARAGHRYVLRAHNTGGRRLRIAKLELSEAGGSTTMGGGLLGYALANSLMSWTLPKRSASYAVGARVMLRGDSDLGALRASAIVSSNE